ncbi:hypothetical protein Drose_03595 [Dactylosporangium roseum]|uniref:DUF2231 domain-containing protein n=1 Tax=Dactylosporangium roseum TaxID=47989 RepID=A0ABY5Z8P8_9ACTN|nr:DUF2231 domain-containing protein [Dactylosporangium roseum]UWZ37380.1 hypothetical protein Drose_03595 [Dactylosporangium roseum]
MFDRVLGLPAHPLFIHAAVVLVPLLALAGILYVVWPGSRRHIRWPLIALAVAAPGAVFFAKESGEAFSESPNFAAGPIQERIEQHEDLANTLFLVVLGLAIVALVMAFMVNVTAGSVSLIKAPVVVHWVVVVAVVALGAAAFYYVFRAGDTGAHMVWEGF